MLKKKIAKFPLLCQFIFKGSNMKIFCMRPTGLIKQIARYELSLVHQECNPNPSIVLAKSSLTSAESGFNPTWSHHFRKTEDLVWCLFLLYPPECLLLHLCYSHQFLCSYLLPVFLSSHPLGLTLTILYLSL